MAPYAEATRCARQARACGWRVASKCALQALLWDAWEMLAFAQALHADGAHLRVPRSLRADRVRAWVEGFIDCKVEEVEGDENTMLLRMVLLEYTRRGKMGGFARSCYHSEESILCSKTTSSEVGISFAGRPPVAGRQSLRLLGAPLRWTLCQLAAADFISSLNEPYAPACHFESKVLNWRTAGRFFIVEEQTGISYFAQAREDVRCMLSIGLQSASDRGTVTLFEFLWENVAVKGECMEDCIGCDDGVMREVRAFVEDALLVLAAPSMALVHRISFFWMHGLKYAKVELCRYVRECVVERTDLTYISRPSPAYTVSSVCDVRVLAEAMRVNFDRTHEDNIAEIFESDSLSVALHQAYDPAKAVRVVPNRHAVNRRRYAGLLAQRRLVVPRREEGMYTNVEATQRIRKVNAESRAMSHEGVVLVCVVAVAVLASVACGVGLSRDPEVNSADIVSTVVVIFTAVMISLPQIYVSTIGGEYSVGDLFRGCVPVQSILRRRGVAFLKECVSRGVDVEPFVSGRHACYLMKRARGSLSIGPVQIRDLDDRWDYGINAEGQLCMRYGGVVGVMQMRERFRPEFNKVTSWWHCAVTDSQITKEVQTTEVHAQLGDNEVG